MDGKLRYTLSAVFDTLSAERCTLNAIRCTLTLYAIRCNVFGTHLSVGNKYGIRGIRNGYLKRKCTPYGAGGHF